MSNQVEAYQKVISILMQDIPTSLDLERIASYVAQNHPTIFLSALGITTSKSTLEATDPLENELYVGVTQEKWTKLDAIKHVRMSTSQTLKECKDYVESLNLPFQY